jgi:hypothetical protein
MDLPTSWGQGKQGTILSSQLFASIFVSKIFLCQPFYLINGFFLAQGLMDLWQLP